MVNNIKIDLQDIEGVGAWLDLAEYTDKWRALVFKVMTFRFLNTYLLTDLITNSTVVSVADPMRNVS